MQRPSHIQLDHNTAKLVARILGLSFDRKIEDVIGDNQFGFIRGKRAMDTIRMLKIMS